MGRYYSLRPLSQRLIVCRSIRIHLLDLLDGSPHRAPHSNVIVWRYPSGVEGAKTQGLALAGSRLMLYVFLRYSTRPGGPVGFGVVLWDWKTGELVRIPWLRLYFPRDSFPGV